MSEVLTPKKFYRLESEAKTDEEMATKLQGYIDRDPTSVLPVLDAMTRYFNVSAIRAMLGKVIELQDPRAYVKHMPEIGRFLEDPDKIRKHFISYHAKNPWYFYCYKDQLKDFFTPGYFEELLTSGVDFFNDPQLFAIFRIFNADVAVEAQPAIIQVRLRALVPKESELGATVLAAREPGFACGGLEKNYMEAKARGEGLCVVNGEYMAKKFHRKSEAKKVTLVPKETRRSADTFVWADHVYAPSQGMHQDIEEALNEGKKEVELPHLAIRPVRPLINLTSEQIFK
ncbi:MAG: hypothetical protein U0519_02640 [Candidatus Gracilibacteria bacterium]